MEYKLILHKETLGITQRALTAMRNELARRIGHEILAYQVPAKEGYCQCYGFFLVDTTTSEVVIIGDGFRGDGEGEGGAGHRAVQALVGIYGLRVVELLPEEGVCYTGDVEDYRGAVDKILEGGGAYRFEILGERPARYVDWCIKPRYQ